MNTILCIILLALEPALARPQASQEWTFHQSMPECLYATAAVTLNNEIHLISGRGAGNRATPVHYIFDPAADSWREGPPKQHATSNFAAAACGNRIHTFGGNDAPEHHEAFDPLKESWENQPAMPTPRQHINYSAASVQGIIHVAGGLIKRGDGRFPTTGCHEAFNTKTGTWETRAPMPTPRQSTALAALEGKLYAIGGHDSTFSPTACVEVYDPGSNSWEILKDMPQACFPAGVAVAGRVIFILTGAMPARGVLDSHVWALNTETMTWTSMGNFPYGVYLAGMTALGNSLFVIGGANTDFGSLDTCLSMEIPPSFSF